MIMKWFLILLILSITTLIAEPMVVYQLIVAEMKAPFMKVPFAEVGLTFFI